MNSPLIRQAFPVGSHGVWMGAQPNGFPAAILVKSPTPIRQIPLGLGEKPPSHLFVEDILFQFGGIIKKNREK